MEWADEGIVIGVRSHGETGAILDLLTRGHGRHLGFVNGGRSRRLRPCLQPGNGLHATWRSRVEEQLGTFTVEAGRLRAAALMESALALHLANHLCALARLLPERDPHPALFEHLEAILDRPTDRVDTPADVVRFEIALLGDLGFGLDLGSCAATGAREDLAFVSPRTGRAVSRAAGEPWRDRLLPLPAFLTCDDVGADRDAVVAGFRLAAFFLERDVFGPRRAALPAGRAAYLGALQAGG